MPIAVADSNTTRYPRISIIVCAYTLDRYRDIVELTDSIANQTFEDIEIIIVTERSKHLNEAILDLVNKMPRLSVSVLHNEGAWGLSHSRNMAIKRAKGDVIAFVDDDAILSPRWAEQTIMDYDQDSSIIGLTGPIAPMWENKNMRWFPREFYWIFSCTYWDFSNKTEVRNGYGTNISFRRKAFEKCGLFRTNLGAKGGGPSGKHELGGEETELSMRVKEQTSGRIIYDPEIGIHHKVYTYRFRLGFISKRAYWEGKTKAMLKGEYGKKYQDAMALSVELRLLSNVLKSIPKEFLKLLSHPAQSIRRIGVIIVVLSSVGVGYLSYILDFRNYRRQISDAA